MALAALALVGGPSCARVGPVAPSPPEADAAWRFRVEAGPGGRELAIEAEFARGSPEELSVSEGAERFVAGVEVERGGAWAGVAPRGGSWFVPACAARGCRVRYRFALAEAAAALDDFDRAAAYEGEAFLAPPSTWLLRPVGASGRGRVRLRVVTPPGVAFVTGWPAAGGAAGEFDAGVDDVDDAPYAGFGRFRTRRLALAGGEQIDLAFAPGALALGDERLADHVASTAAAVAAFYGRFPVGRALVVVAPADAPGVAFGKTSGGGGGAAVVLVVGAAAGEADLRRDWVTAHEMIHLGFPWLPRRQRWLEEGLATYVEPLVRLRAGRVDEASVWHDFVSRMPQGLPRPGDRGLDHTPTWGRTYWGGAIFCLLADVEIRKRTGGARSLEDALRAVVRAGGNASARWGVGEALAAGDAAVGAPVLRELYDAMSAAPAPVDLDRLWRELGVRLEGASVRFDDAAPLAPVRAAMTGGRSGAPVGRREPAPPIAPSAGGAGAGAARRRAR